MENCAFRPLHERVSEMVGNMTTVNINH